MIDDNVAFGSTVAMDYKAYREDFRDKLHPKAHKDSAYGVCSRILIETVALQAREFWGPDTVVNFVFERSDHFAEAERNFHDAKRHIHELTPHLGKIAPGEKGEFCGLQAADLQACLRGRIEPRVPFKKTDGRFESLAEARKAADGCPIFHFVLAGDLLQEIREPTESISKEKKWGKRKRGFERRKARES